MHITSLSTALVIAASTLVAGKLDITEPKENTTLTVKSNTTIVWDTNIGGKVSVFLAGGTDANNLQQCGNIAGESSKQFDQHTPDHPIPYLHTTLHST